MQGSTKVHPLVKSIGFSANRLLRRPLSEDLAHQPGMPRFQHSILLAVAQFRVYIVARLVTTSHGIYRTALKQSSIIWEILG